MHKKTRNSTVQLALLGLLGAALWRLEIEWHGWEGLIWVSYFHWALPVGLLAFIVWGYFQVKNHLRQKWKYWILSLIFTILGYFVLLFSMAFAFVGGPRGIFLMQLVHQKIYPFIVQSLPIVVISIPLIPLLILRIMGIKPKTQNILFSSAGMAVSVPLSFWLLEITHHIGGADFLHAVKSGYIIPFWYVSLGLVFMGCERKVN